MDDRDSDSWKFCSDLLQASLMGNLRWKAELIGWENSLTKLVLFSSILSTLGSSWVSEKSFPSKSYERFYQSFLAHHYPNVSNITAIFQ